MMVSRGDLDMDMLLILSGLGGLGGGCRGLEDRLVESFFRYISIFNIVMSRNKQN